MKNKTASLLCPCHSSKHYAQCCARYLDDHQPAPSAEALMRSRYTAYACCRADYLLATWHPSTRPITLELEPATNPQWIRLEIKQHIPEGDHATVEFIATYKTGGRAHRLHETSSFLKEEGRWYYVDGILH